VIAVEVQNRLSHKSTLPVGVFSHLDLGQMTLMLDLDRDILKMYVLTRNEVCRSGH